jgi:GT2 family glycosyltransferase
VSIRVSVIVATHNRKDLLLRLLDSLFSQTLPAEEYEVIVVCDHPTDGSNQSVRNLCQGCSRLRLIERWQRRGPAAARNAGAKIAQGKYLAFTDDDCVPSPQWLEKVVETFERHAAIGVEGRTITVPAETTPLTHQVENEGQMDLVPTCNAACLREAFEKIGGFSEEFSFPFNEDADFTWRLASLGEICYAPGALVVHPPRPETFASKARLVRYLESEFLLFARNPVAYRKYRSRSPWLMIYWRVFVLSHLGQLKPALGDILRRRRPDFFAIRLFLIAARMLNLILLYPRFRRASQRCTEDRRSAELCADKLSA